MIKYTKSTASRDEIRGHLARCAGDFIPPLDNRITLTDYASKLEANAVTFEAWDDLGQLVGLLAIYEREWFITNVSVLPEHRGRGIAGELMKRCVEYAQAKCASMLALDVSSVDKRAYSFYLKQGFSFLSSPSSVPPGSVRMIRPFVAQAQRNFDAEARDTPAAKYAYDFDTEVMHPMMVRTFEPWFRKPEGVGSCLELGSYEGVFTKRLREHFLPSFITCVEASREAANKAARRQLGVTTHLFPFETVQLGRGYDNIFCTHVLEHVDDPVLVLRRINDEWLAPGGRLFLAVPNGNAASRRIAVHMGLVENCMAVTPDEEAHGHRRTYDLDLLEYHSRLAGLKVIVRGGIFFKALANFQIDKAKAAGIVNDAYLEGCYRLGQQFTDLCASVYLICEKGEAK